MEPFKILFLDDTPESRLPVATLLRFRNMEVTESSEPPDALALLSANTFDLIITDYQMPYMNGLDFIAAAKKAGCTAPFILYSGNFAAIADAQRADIEAYSKSTTGTEFLLESATNLQKARASHEL